MTLSRFFQRPIQLRRRTPLALLPSSSIIRTHGGEFNVNERKKRGPGLLCKGRLKSWLKGSRLGIGLHWASFRSRALAHFSFGMVWAVVGGLNGLSSLAPGYYCGSYSRIRRARVSRNWGQWTASKRVKKNCKLFSRSRIPILSLLSLHIFLLGLSLVVCHEKALLGSFPHHLMTIDIKESMKSFLMMINIDYLPTLQLHTGCPNKFWTSQNEVEAILLQTQKVSTQSCWGPL